MFSDFSRHEIDMRLEKEKLKIELEFGEKIFYCRWTSIINNILIQQNFETEPDNSDLEGVEVTFERSE